MPSGFAERGALLVALAAVLWLGCGRQEGCDDPEEVLNFFFASVEAGDQETAYGLLDAESRNKLVKIADETNRTTGRSFKPHEFIVPQRFDRKPELSRIQAGEGGKDPNMVVTYKDGSSRTFPLTKEGNCYKVNLDI